MGHYYFWNGQGVHVYKCDICKKESVFSSGRDDYDVDHLPEDWGVLKRNKKSYVICDECLEKILKKGKVE